jgi:hypothetical protein
LLGQKQQQGPVAAETQRRVMHLRARHVADVSCNLMRFISAEPSSAVHQLLKPAGMNAGSFSSMNCFTWGDLNTSMKALSRGLSFLSGLAVNRSTNIPLSE